MSTSEQSAAETTVPTQVLVPLYPHLRDPILFAAYLFGAWITGGRAICVVCHYAMREIPMPAIVMYLADLPIAVIDYGFYPYSLNYVMFYIAPGTFLLGALLSISPRMGVFALALMKFACAMAIGLVFALFVANEEETWGQRRTMEIAAPIISSLEQYRWKHNDYPEQLSALDYPPEVPDDGFTLGAGFMYQRTTHENEPSFYLAVDYGSFQRLEYSSKYASSGSWHFTSGHKRPLGGGWSVDFDAD